ncbi:MAG: glycosyltransferase [Cyanobacteria bacterium P01_F01_bin.56]
MSLQTVEWPQISVIVPIYNGATDIPNLGECLCQQTYPKNRVEYLLINNNSSDSTMVCLQEWQVKAQALGLQVKLLSESEIQSSYAARNQGIRAANGEILAFTDADCRPHADWLTTLIHPFQDAHVGLVIGEIAALPGNSLLEQYAEYREMMTQRYTYSHSFYPYGQTANLAVRKAAFVQAGLFRPYLTTGGDADLCWRVQLAGSWRVYFEPKAIIRHRHRATFKDLASQWRRYGRSNQYLHELHHVNLGPNVSSRTIARRLTQWLAQDLPKATWKVLRGKAPSVALVSVPLDVYCARARSVGQQQAQLPEAAREIVWLENSDTTSTKTNLKPEINNLV